jgi:hypothetical protein
VISKLTWPDSSIGRIFEAVEKKDEEDQIFPIFGGGFGEQIEGPRFRGQYLLVMGKVQAKMLAKNAAFYQFHERL